MNRTQLALKIKSLDYELIKEYPHDKKEIVVKNNSVYKKIPILIHVDMPFCASMINVEEYTDDAWPNGPSLLPSGGYDRAMAYYWAKYIDDKVQGYTVLTFNY